MLLEFRKNFLLGVFLFFGLGLPKESIYAQDDISKLVNPFVGTGGHGHTFPGALVPHGMVQVSPDTRLDGWDGCSGYHDSDNLIYGFSHTHLSGTGVEDLCDILLASTTHFTTSSTMTYQDIRKQFSKKFSKRDEVARAGFYSVRLGDEEIFHSVTAGKRTAMHQLRFGEGVQKVYVLVDLVHRDALKGTNIIVDSSSIYGYRYSSSWASDQRLYYKMVSSSPIKRIKLNNSLDSLVAVVEISLNSRSEVNLKVGLSYVDSEGASSNLSLEMPGWDFSKYVNNADSLWLSELEKVTLDGDDLERKKVFYTAMYHTKCAPNLFSDCDGRYRGMDKKIYRDSLKEQYSIFSLWDTYRSTHPLFNLMDKKRNLSYLNTFCNQYQQGGLLPVWELVGNETNCMIGYHSVSVIADASVKGVINDLDNRNCLEGGMLKASNQKVRGIDIFNKNGFVASDYESESVSKTLEYAYDDWCIGRYFGQHKNDDIERIYAKRSKNYINLFHPDNHFFVAKKNGGFLNSFVPEEVNQHYTEANAWQYSLACPHDISTLIELHGGDAHFKLFLDRLFKANSKTTGREQSDITGLIGQYAHGNEPSHHIAYCYSLIGEYGAMQKILDHINRHFYTNKPDGLIGNEDCGQMSAWYIWSNLGLYPFCPGDDRYLISKPGFKRIELKLENGKLLRIHCNDPRDSVNIQKVYFNGKEYKYNYFHHADIEAGGEISIICSSEPSTWNPVRAIFRTVVVDFEAIPFIVNGAVSFEVEKEIELRAINPRSSIFYSLNGKPYKRYKGKFLIKEDKSLAFFSVSVNHVHSDTVFSKFRKWTKKAKIISITDFANQYAASGKNALLDGELGGLDFRTGGWQGTWGKDIEIVLKCDAKEEIKELILTSLQDQNAWIIVPREVECFQSSDGIKFESLGISKSKVPLSQLDPVIQSFSFALPRGLKYLKLLVKNAGKLPSWHKGSGGDSWIFLDEIKLK